MVMQHLHYISDCIRVDSDYYRCVQCLLVTQDLCQYLLENEELYTCTLVFSELRDSLAQ